jgi:hypothetical protein
VKAHDQALLGQALYVTAHGLQRYAQGVGELLDGGALALAHFFEQLQLAGIVHAGSLQIRASTVKAKQNEKTKGNPEGHLINKEQK